MLDSYLLPSKDCKANRALSNSQGVPAFTLCFFVLVEKVIMKRFFPTSLKEATRLSLHIFSIVVCIASLLIFLSMHILPTKLRLFLIRFSFETSSSTIILVCSSYTNLTFPHCSSNMWIPSMILINPPTVWKKRRVIIFPPLCLREPPKRDYPHSMFRTSSPSSTSKAYLISLACLWM